jgi:signal transduction histidine kinase/CheY-like chemotaxis protein
MIGIFFQFPSHAQPSQERAPQEQKLFEDRVASLITKTSNLAALELTKYIPQQEAQEKAITKQSPSVQFDYYFYMLGLYGFVDNIEKINLTNEKITVLANENNLTQGHDLVSLYQAYVKGIQGSHQQSVPILKDLEETFKRQNNTKLQLEALILIGLIEGKFNNHNQAISSYTEASRMIVGDKNNVKNQLKIYWGLGFVYTMMSNQEKVLFYYEKSLELAEENNLPIDTFTSLYNIAYTLSDNEIYNLSNKVWAAYSAAINTFNDRKNEFYLYYGLTVLNFKIGNESLTQFYAEKALTDLSVSSFYWPVLQQILSEIYANNGDISLAQSHLEIAENFYIDQPDMRLSRWGIYQNKVRAALESAKGNHEEANLWLIKYSDLVIKLSQRKMKLELQDIQSTLEAELQQHEADDKLLASQREIAEIQLSQQQALNAAGFAILFILIVGILLQARMTKALKESKQTAEFANINKTEFLANISHEIRTPLNGLMGAINLIHEKNINKEVNDLCNLAESSSEMLHNIINDILDISKLDHHKVVLNKKPTDIHKIITDLTSPLLKAINKKGLFYTQTIDIDENLLLVIDKTRVSQIILNLLTNAIKFTEKGSITLDANLTTKGKQTSLAISVTDTGIGISLEDIDRLFKRFEQVSKSNYLRNQGTGLGLSIYKRLIDLMNGQQNVKSVISQGSQFSFYIPVETINKADYTAKNDTADNNEEIILFKGDELDLKVQGKDDQLLKTLQPLSSGTLEKPKKLPKLHILIAEDIPLNQMLIKQYLRNSDCTYEIVENGQMVVDMIKDFDSKKEIPNFDVILMDIQMPIMGGIEATEIIRRSASNLKNIPIIALTANAHDEMKKECLEMGFTGFISKPFTKDDLRLELNKL